VIEANKVILDIEMNLHVKLWAGWGLSPSDLEQTPPAVEISGHQPSWPSPGRSVADAAYAGLLFPTLVYAEKVRSQFLSLRQFTQCHVFSAANSSAIKPSSRSHFQFELWSPDPA
jgi:hypothetical protein